jgi:hypothetical protein
MKGNKHIQTFEQHQENLNISDVSDSKILYQVEILGDNFELREEKEIEFTDDGLLLKVYKNNEEIDIDTELDKFLLQFKTTKLSVDDMCKFIHFYDKFNELCL